MNRDAAQARLKETQSRGGGLLNGALSLVRPPLHPLLIDIAYMTSLSQMGRVFSSPTKTTAAEKGDGKTASPIEHDHGDVLSELMELDTEGEEEEPAKEEEAPHRYIRAVNQ